jgi:hypothetical protein
LDKQAVQEHDVHGAVYSYGYDTDEQQRHLEGIEQKLNSIDTFLERVEERKGASGDEVPSNITDHESGKIKGSHGSIQGYKGIAVGDGTIPIIGAAEVCGSGSKGEHFTAMVTNLAGQLQGLKGKDKPLEGSIGDGDRGYCTEHHLKEGNGRLKGSYRTRNSAKGMSSLRGGLSMGGSSGLRRKTLFMMSRETATGVLQGRSVPAKGR